LTLGEQRLTWMVVARARVIAIAIVLGWALTGVSLGASASSGRAAHHEVVPKLSAEERAALASRQVVARPLRFGHHGGSYVGGISYQVVRAESSRILSALANAESLPQALPDTLEARMVSRGGRTARVELVQGRAPFLVRYTLVLEQAEDGSAIRFWLDRSRHHDVSDVWGYFRVEPFGAGKSLVTVAAAVDLGQGLGRALFEDRVQRSILRAPSRIRSFIEPPALASAR
jgi:hypothetical protein